MIKLYLWSNYSTKQLGIRMEQLEETEEVDRSHKQQNLTQNAEGCITCKTKTDVNQNSFMSSYVLNKHQIGEIHYGMHIQNPKCFFPFF